jgi:hypothetical protein
MTPRSSAFVLLTLLREEGASKSLPEVLTPKPGYKLVRTRAKNLIIPAPGKGLDHVVFIFYN